MFQVVGSLRKKERDDPGRASWSTLAEYLKVAEQCEQPKKRLAPDAGVGLLADSDRELDAGESHCSLLFDDEALGYLAEMMSRCVLASSKLGGFGVQFRGSVLTWGIWRGGFLQPMKL